MSTLLPANPMLDVLNDAIASKCDTISLLERTAKDALTDLTHLRETRARLLAKQAGFEVGQVWLVSSHNRPAHRPGILYDIKPAYGECGDKDWRLTFLFDEAQYRGEKPNTDDVTASYCEGRVTDGPLVCALTARLSAVLEQQAKAA